MGGGGRAGGESEGEGEGREVPGSTCRDRARRHSLSGAAITGGCIILKAGHCSSTAGQALKGQCLMLPLRLLPASPVGKIEGLADAGAGVIKHVD